MAHSKGPRNYANLRRGWWRWRRRLDSQLPEPLARRRMQPLVPEREPALTLGGEIEQGVLEPAEGAAAVQSTLQPAAKPRIAHRPGEICHPPILDLGAERLAVE